MGNDAYHEKFDPWTCAFGTLWASEAKMFHRMVPMYRITRARDPVVHVPPLPIYRHVGAEAYFVGDSTCSGANGA